MQFQKITIIGVGLLGGSIGLAVKRRKLAREVAGFVRRDASLKDCEKAGAVDYATTTCIPLPSPFSFFRVREGIAINPYFPPPAIASIQLLFNGVLLSWGGPTNVQYQVQWTPILVPPAWTPFLVPPAVTSTSGLFQFLDDGSQTGGLGATRYYRLLQLP